MPDNESIDELVDEIINELKDENKEIEKRKPKPFRYLSIDEAKEELKEQEKTNISIMKTTETPTILPEELCVLGLGDMETIENILQRHEASRKIIER